MNKVGETNIAKNGLKMEIIAFRSDKDIDVKFENGTIIEGKTYLSFKRGTINLPSEQKEQVNITLDKEARELLREYSKTIGKNASEVINNLIKTNCVDFNNVNSFIFGTYGNDVSYIKNFDYSVLSKMSKEEFISRYVTRILDEMQTSIYYCIAPECVNGDYSYAKNIYFEPYNNHIKTIEDTTTMLLDLFDESIKTIEDIVIAMFGTDSDEHYIVKIYNKFLNECNNDDAECWKHMYDYGVYIDDYTKKNPNGTYYTRIGNILNILSCQGREDEIVANREKQNNEFLETLKHF